MNLFVVSSHGAKRNIEKCGLMSDFDIMVIGSNTMGKFYNYIIVSVSINDLLCQDKGWTEDKLTSYINEDLRTRCQNNLIFT